MVESEIKEYLSLSLKGLSNVKEITIIPGMEYQFSFYDPKYGTKRTIIGLVTGVYKDQVKVKCTNGKDTVDCGQCSKRNDCAMAKNQPNLYPIFTCNCILNPPDTSKYDDPVTYFIPLDNLMDVSYIKNKPEGGVKVMILGISATVVKAIIIGLEFFDDCCSDAVKYVELQKDNIYDIKYEAKNGVLYQNRAKVINIEECNQDFNNDCCRNSIVRENVGMNNRVYCCNGCHDKVDFMKAPPVRKINITIDVSENFDGDTRIITLDSIRDCTLVEPENSTTSEPETDIETGNTESESDSVEQNNVDTNIEETT